MTRTAFQLRDVLDQEIDRVIADASRTMHARGISMLASKMIYSAAVQSRYFKMQGRTDHIAFLEEPRARAQGIPKLRRAK